MDKCNVGKHMQGKEQGEKRQSEQLIAQEQELGVSLNPIRDRISSEKQAKPEQVGYFKREGGPL